MNFWSYATTQIEMYKIFYVCLSFFALRMTRWTFQTVTTTKRFPFFCLFFVHFTSSRFGAMIFIFNYRIVLKTCTGAFKTRFLSRWHKVMTISEKYNLLRWFSFDVISTKKNLLDKVSFLNRRRIFNMKEICHFKWTLHWETFNWKLKCRCDSQTWFLFWIQKNNKNHDFLKKMLKYSVQMHSTTIG